MLYAQETEFLVMLHGPSLPRTSGIQLCLHDFLTVSRWIGSFTSHMCCFFAKMGIIEAISSILNVISVSNEKPAQYLLLYWSLTNLSFPFHFPTFQFKFLTKVYVITPPRDSSILRGVRRCHVGTCLRKSFLGS